MNGVDRSIVVTGATSRGGIGVAVAERFARDGWGVVVLGRRTDRAAEVAGELRTRFEVPALGCGVDVASESAVADLCRAVTVEVSAGALPPIAALANIAGITSPVPFLDTTLAEWDRVMAVNATGTYLMTKAFLPEMIERRWGRVVNMSSVAAQRGGGMFGKVAYSASKAAVLGLTRALAREVAGTGVTVNAVAPGVVDTSIRVGFTPEQEAALVGGIPLGRPASPHEIAAVVAFLASDDGGYLTGATVDVNGGSHIR